jgi:glycosyltransferase involved in cell wall biosynthesis
MNPVLSVVVIGRNEGLRLERCLRSVRKMIHPSGEIELIYVDSASTDNSTEIARSLGAKVLTVNAPRPTAALGRNVGWRAATAQFVLFLDGDTILHPRFVVDALPEFHQSTVAAVWGHRREIHPERSFFNRILDLDWIYRPGVSEFCGGDVLMRRSALLEVDGYDEALIAGEEPEMCRRLRGRGHTILHVDLPMTGHDLAMTRIGQYWKRATRAGYAYAEVSDRFRGSLLPFWEDEVERNGKRAQSLIGIAACGVLGALVLRNPLPMVALFALLALLAVRTAYKTRWKSASPITLLAYGLHSHLQQIPIYFGQLQFQQDRKRGRTRGLIEYKGVSE